MKKMKKFTSLGLVLCLLLSCVTFAVSAETEEIAEEPNPGYVESVNRNEAILLATLGIHRDFSYPDAEVTRLNFAKAMLKMLCITEYSAGALTFADVENEEELAIINTAIQYGIFEVPPTEYFRPNESLTVSEAALVCLDILGYREPAKVAGESNKAQDLKKVSTLGLLDGVDAAYEDALTLRHMTTLFYNTLHTDLMVQVGFGETKRYQVMEGRTLMHDYWKLDWDTGRMTANEVTGLLQVGEVDDGYCKIDGEVYQTGETEAGVYLGYRVRYYYDENKTLVCVTPTEDNTLITVEPENLGAGSTLSQVSYYDSETGREKTLRMAENKDVIYNHGADFDAEDADLFIASGLLQFLDYDGDYRYDVIFIREFETVVTENTVSESHAVVDALTGKATLLDPSDFDHMTYVKQGENGEAVTYSFDAITAGDVLLIEKDRSGRNVQITASSKQIYGQISIIREADKTVSLGEAVYSINQTYWNEWKKANEKTKHFTAGASGTLYLDAFGKVAYGILKEAELQYGYFSASAEQGNFAAKVLLRVLAADNTWNTYPVAERYKLNGVSTKNMQDVQNALASGPQLIKYALNGSKEIIELETAQNRSGETAYIGYDTENFTKDAVVNEYYRSTPMGFGKHCFIGTGEKQTVIFNVPDSAIRNGRLAEDKVFAYSSTVFRNSKKYNVDVYDCDEFKVAGAIVWKDDLAEMDENYELRLLYVNEWLIIYDAEGNKIKMISGYYNGKLRNFICPDIDVENDVKSGDVLRIKLLPDGSIREIDKIVSLNDPASGLISPEVNGAYNLAGGTANANTEAAVYIGDVFKVDYTGGRFTLKLGLEASPTPFYSKGVSVLRYNQEEMTFEAAAITETLGSVSGIQPLDRVLVYERYAIPYDMVILD